jgi:NitT/TauT family transport system permease protein
MISQPVVTQSKSFLVDLSVAVVLAAIGYALIRVTQDLGSPMQPQTEIHLGFHYLFGYTLLSLLRGFVAYGFSLLFTLFYGYTAASNRRAERVMIPLLDVLQSIPVLGFLPGAVLALVALFPHHNMGLEIACIMMIFTGQVWNMSFSFYHSMKTIPAEFKEVAELYHFSPLQRFLRLELPFSSVGLAWNSMLSMAGGWFFLMICESFTLGDQKFRVAGLGAYMSEAVARMDVTSILAGVAAMILMILAVDRFLWRPVIYWTERFRIEDVQSRREPPLVWKWLRRSWLLTWAIPALIYRFNDWLGVLIPKEFFKKLIGTTGASLHHRPSKTTRGFGFLITGLVILLCLWSAGHLGLLLLQLKRQEWFDVLLGALFSFMRVGAAVVLGSLWAIPVGIWIGRSEQLSRRLQPVVQVAASFPVPMLYPLIFQGLQILGFRLGMSSIILMLLGTQWYILFNVIAGASNAPKDLLEVSRSFHFSSWQKLRVFWGPSILPYLVTGWITAAGGAWNASIVAEYVMVNNQAHATLGLGSLISMAAAAGRYNLLASAVVVMSLVVVLTNRFLWKPIYQIAEQRYAP